MEWKPDHRYTMDAQRFAQDVPGPVHCVITDPPWTISGGGLFLEAAPYQLQSTGDIAQILGALRKKCVRGAHAYVFLPSGNVLQPAIHDITQQGWRFLRLLVWDKAPWGGTGLGGTWRNAFEPIGIFANGSPRPYQRGKQFPTTLRQRSHFTRTSKPASLYRVFLEASTKPGELIVDPWCGLDPLAEACSREPRRRWISSDILTPTQVLSQARRKSPRL